ncbi:MAG: C40 family peptidase [Chitinophagales bacterium]|nr:C40 family peptidase [Chitinophagales bacterium]
MTHGIVNVSALPLRKEPSHRSEMVSQLLFGETYEVKEKKAKEWLRIVCNYDGYEGWLNESSFHSINEKEYQQQQAASKAVSLDIVSAAMSDTNNIPILCGSTLPLYDGISFKLHKEKFIFNGAAMQQEQPNASMVEKIALKYLNAPYLWGGRSPFGIDCSGFTQVVFKCLFTALKRDAYQQAEQGIVVNFIEEALPGDLAFFANEEENITHVGIVLKDRQIIHASGKVRIDKLDHFGIFNVDKKKYSHRLKILKRLL